MAARVLLLHWDEPESAKRAEELAASGFAVDRKSHFVRAAGLGAGLVDYKVCAVDETWSGLLFRRRR